MDEHVLAVLANNVERCEDIVFDADALLDNCSDPGLHPAILGIKAVADNSANSLKALIEHIRSHSAEVGKS